MRVLFLCGREEGYTRNQVLLRAFQQFAQVTPVTDPDPSKSIPRRSLGVFWRALPALLRGDYDLVFVGFYGHLLMLPVGLLARKPVLFDAFISTYDTLISDRQAASPKSPAAFFSFALDWITTRQARHVLLDTPLQADYFQHTFHLPAQKISALPVGCNEAIFFPQPAARQGDSHVGGPLRVLYYCTYLPLHGADIVVQAAALQQAAPIQFRLIGSGPEYEKTRRLAAGLKNIEFLPPVSLEDLAAEISAADICLGGHFGTSDKAGRVVPGKIYQMLAMEKPIIAASSPANRALLAHLHTAFLCPPGDPGALAEAIESLAENPTLRAELAANGRRLYEQTSSEAAITQGLQAVVQKLCGRVSG